MLALSADGLVVLPLHLHDPKMLQGISNCSRLDNFRAVGGAKNSCTILLTMPAEIRAKAS